MDTVDDLAKLISDEAGEEPIERARIDGKFMAWESARPLLTYAYDAVFWTATKLIVLQASDRAGWFVESWPRTPA